MRVTKIPTTALIIFTATAAFIYSCSSKKGDTPNPANPNPVTCDTTNVTYAGTINPIVQQNCAVSGCHTNASQAGGYSYQTFAGLKSAVTNNRLLGAINHQSGFVPMPQSAAKLSDCDIQKITLWVAMGAPNN
jgi:cytochrome c553